MFTNLNNGRGVEIFRRFNPLLITLTILFVSFGCRPQHSKKFNTESLESISQHENLNIIPVSFYASKYEHNLNKKFLLLDLNIKKPSPETSGAVLYLSSSKNADIAELGSVASISLLSEQNSPTNLIMKRTVNITSYREKIENWIKTENGSSIYLFIKYYPEQPKELFFRGNRATIRGYDQIPVEDNLFAP